jgi:hypothetical protein
MYIRTECGMIFNYVSPHPNIYIIKGTFKWELCYYLKYYKIKSQGDNLIDVLEDKDIVIWKYRRALEDVYDTTRTFWGSHSNKNIKEDMILKVITHEQYEPLKQEVK